MIVFIIGFLLLFIGLYLVQRSITQGDSDVPDFFSTLVVTGGVVLVVGGIIALSYLHASAGSAIARYHELCKLVDQSDDEKAMEDIYGKVADVNMGLASAKYWNKTLLDIFVPDQIAALEFIVLPKSKAPNQEKQR